MTSKRTRTPVVKGNTGRVPRRKVATGPIGRRYRSGFEEILVKQINSEKLRVHYEETDLKYTVYRKYTPDFRLGRILIEAKGYFNAADRSKHLSVKEQNPDRDIRFVFMNAKVKLYRGSSTTYADWCDKYGFKWAEGKIPQAWINEAKEHLRESARGPRQSK